ncbi:hypothetical protein IKF89_03035 [Candidatus Saccharibacteria bacterium]|nr:hypothetical protein [Candidatus Saccharibacteria bacterium]
MANKKKDNKNVIIGSICAVVVVVVIVIVAVVLATSGGNRLNDNYFQSDGQKYVLTIETDQTSIEGTDEQYVPVKTHLVYTYSGDDITGLKLYYEYADENTAKKALEEMKAAAGNELGEAVIEGKYVIATAPEEQYKDLKAADVKAQIDFMEQLKNMNSNSQGTNSTNGEVVESTTEENTTEEQK